MRKYAPTILLALTLPIGEIHSRFINSPLVQNWILHISRPMALSWNLKKVEEQALIIMYFGAWILWKDNEINRITIRAFFFLAILDTILYFYNYKTDGFVSVYVWLGGCWILAFHWKKLTKWLWKHLHTGRDNPI